MCCVYCVCYVHICVHVTRAIVPVGSSSVLQSCSDNREGTIPHSLSVLSQVLLDQSGMLRSLTPSDTPSNTPSTRPCIAP